MALVAVVLHALVRASNILLCAADKCLFTNECSTLSYHVEAQYVIIGTTTRLYKVFIIWVFSPQCSFASLFIDIINLISLSRIYFACAIKFNFSSIITPRYLICVLYLTFMPFIFNIGIRSLLSLPFISKATVFGIETFNLWSPHQLFKTNALFAIFSMSILEFPLTLDIPAI